MAKKKVAKKAAPAPRAKKPLPKAGKKKAAPVPKAAKPAPKAAKKGVTKAKVSPAKAPAAKKKPAKKTALAKAARKTAPARVVKTAKAVKKPTVAPKAVRPAPKASKTSKAARKPVVAAAKPILAKKTAPAPKTAPKAKTPQPSAKAAPAVKTVRASASPVSASPSKAAPVSAPAAAARPSTSPSAPAPVSPASKAPAAAPAPVAATKPPLPPRPFVPPARSILGIAALPPGGLPAWWQWHQDYPGEETLRRGTVLTSFNSYGGIYTDTLRIHMAAGQSGIRAVSYSSRFVIDGSGSGGKLRGDAAYKDSTSLHYNDGQPPSKKNSLNALEYPFAVLPLPPRNVSVPHFQSLGLDVGDIGIAFFGRGLAAPFVYGNEGPSHLVGQGSVQMARDLGLEWEEMKMTIHPPLGGFDEQGMRQFAPGVLHIAFPGSRERADRITEVLTREALHAKAWDLFKRWKQSLRGGAV